MHRPETRPETEELVRSALADAFIAEGIETFFGVVGDDTIPFMTDLVNAGATYQPARHEAVAVGMADGFSWATGAIGLAVLTRGPGLVNGLTAARSAVRGHRQVIIVVGDSPVGSDHKADLKYVEPGPIIRAAGLVHAPIERAGDEVRAAVRAAVAAARSGMPAVITVPENILNGLSSPAAVGSALDATSMKAAPAIAVSATAETASESPAESVVVEPTTADIAHILGLLNASSYPLILVGAGAADENLRQIYADIAESCGALLGTSLGAKDFFVGNRLYLGTVGGWATDPAIPLLAQVDCVISFGASLNTYTTAERTLFSKASVVQVDSDAASLGRYFTVDLEILADAATTARKLLTALPDRVNSDRPFHDPEVIQSLTQPAYLGADESTTDELDPRGLAQRIGQLLPTQRTVVLDSGRFMSWPGRFVTTTGPAGFRLSVEFGAIGTGLGVALGVALARPETPTVLFTGDGGLSMMLGDLATAARLKVPLLIAVFNDRAYGAERWHQERRNLPTDLADLESIEFADVARALGMDAAVVRTSADLEELADQLGRINKPLLVDCKIRRELALARYVRWE